jgi:hypothetical protein
MKNSVLLLILLILIPKNTFSQVKSDSSVISLKHYNIAAQSIAGVASLAGLGSLWYSDQFDGKFKSINDSQTWLQIDKLGHSVTAYQISNQLYHINLWSGFNEAQAVGYAYLTSTLFQLSIEVMDGFSEGYGFSFPDIGANLFGTSLFLGQQLLFKDQPIKLTFSFSNSGLQGPFTNELEKDRARKLYGTTFLNNLFKDYNGQTYWLSVNLWKIAGKPNNFPKWLNLDFGYSVDNVLGSFSNGWRIQQNGKSVVYTSELPRTRQFLFSFSVDTENLKIFKKLQGITFVFSTIKMPAPALEYNNQKEWTFHPFYF